MDEIIVKIFKYRTDDFVYSPFIYLDGTIINDITKSEQERYFFYNAVGLFANKHNIKEIYVCWNTDYGFSYYNPRTNTYQIVNHETPTDYQFNPKLRTLLISPINTNEILTEFSLRMLDELKYI